MDRDVSTYKQNARTAGRIIDGAAFVITPDDNKLHVLNATGTRVWTLAEPGCTLASIAEALAAEFDVDMARAMVDAHAFCDDLVKRKVLDCE